MKLTLMPRLLLFILLPALIGMACITGFSFFAARDTLTAQIAADMTLVVERQKSELENVTLLLRQAIITATYFPSIQTLLEEKDTDTSFEHQEALTKKVRADLQEIIGHFSQISGMALLDANGKVLVHSNAEMEGTNRSDRGYFKTAIMVPLVSKPCTAEGQKTWRPLLRNR